MPRGGACLAAKAYFVLRRAIRKHDPASPIRPSTKLANIVRGRFSDRHWHCQLKEDTVLRLPALMGCGVLYLIAIGFLLVGSAAHGWIGALIALPVSIGLFALSHRVARLSTRLRTVGDLAEAVAVLNVAGLASPDEPLREREIWTALRGVIGNNLGWDGSVLPTTRLIQNGYTRLTRLHWVAIGAGLAILMFLVGWLRVHFIAR